MNPYAVVRLLGTGVIALWPSITFGATRGTDEGMPARLPPQPTLTAPDGADSAVRFKIESGTNKLIRVEGSGHLHEWRLESRTMGGYIELDPGKPAEALPGTMSARGELRIPVRSLKSVDINGKPFSDAMDNIARLKLNGSTNDEIRYALNRLALKEAPGGNAPWVFESKGDLTVAGVKKEVTIPVAIEFDSGGLRFSARTRLKMSDFGIDPPVATTEQGPFKLANDEVTVTVESGATAPVHADSRSQPLAVLFLGNTNGMGASVISNQWNSTVKVWASAWVEVPPFADERSEKWIWVIGPSDRYLKPGETIYWTFTPPDTGGKWRLRIPWSEGYRAEISDWSRWHNIVGPGSVWIAPEYYAASPVVTE